MEVEGTSFVKFLGFKRKSKMPIIESPTKKKEFMSAMAVFMGRVK